MEKLQHFKILIIEDDEFYNKLLSKYINVVLSELSATSRFTFELVSFSNYNDCVRNFDDKTSLVITDYYLENSRNASYFLNFVKKRLSSCKVVVISRQKNAQTAFGTRLDGAYDFFPKDETIFDNCRELLYTLVTEKTTQINNN